MDQPFSRNNQPRFSNAQRENLVSKDDRTFYSEHKNKKKRVNKRPKIFYVLMIENSGGIGSHRYQYGGFSCCLLDSTSSLSMIQTQDIIQVL